MTSLGRVRVWNIEEGWGVIDSAATPGGCWTHYSGVLVAGYKSLHAGQDVRFNFEAAEQDGYTFRAVEAWPAEESPVPLSHMDSDPSPTPFDPDPHFR